MRRNLFIFTLLFSYNAICLAGGVYQSNEDFIKETFSDEAFEKKVIWPDTATQAVMEEILGHKYKGLRIRYWINAGRTAWILEEIGKEKPITTGIVIAKNKIERVKILAFRESRGWEVKHEFFTDQFNNAGLIDKNESEANQLDRPIDNISGATLSVRAVSKLSRIALLLHKAINNDGQP